MMASMAPKVAFLAVVLGLTGSAASPIVIRHDVDDARYLALGRELEQALVQMNLEASGDPPDGEGTLIAPEWVLTAAHVGEEVEPGHRLTVSGTEYEAEGVFLHPDWDGGASDDLALIRLARPVAGVEPVPVYPHGDEVGRLVTVVGRGDFGTGESGPVGNDGRVRGATNEVDSADEKLLGWRFHAPAEGAVTELEGISGPGDSGGPAFVEVDGRRWLVGVSSAQSTRATGGREGVYGVTEYYARVSSYLRWIEGVIGQSR